MNTDNQSDKKIRIMLVEDHILMRIGLVSATRIEPDMTVVAEVDDGRKAVENFRKHKPDVILLDLRLPGMDGLQVIKALRQESPDVRIVVLSSYGGGDDVTRAIQAGASGYVLKSMPLQQVAEQQGDCHRVKNRGGNRQGAPHEHLCKIGGCGSHPGNHHGHEAPDNTVGVILGA